MSGPMPRRDLESTLSRLVAQAATAQDDLLNEQERLSSLQESVNTDLQSVARIVSQNRDQIFIGGVSRADVNGLWICLGERFEFDAAAYDWMPADLISFYGSLAKFASYMGIDAAGASAELREFALKQPYLRRIEIISVEDQAGRVIIAELQPSTN